MRHVRADLEELSQRGRIEVRSSGLSSQDIIIALIRRTEENDKNAHRRGVNALEIIGECDSIVLMPVTYSKGWANYRIITIIESALPAMFRRLERQGDVRAVTRIPVKNIPIEYSLMFSTGELFSKITDKQARAFLAAVELGYFRTPRETRFEDISRLVGMPRTTFETHVRKAESKILTHIAPYLAAHFKQADAPGRQPFPGPLKRLNSGQMTAEFFYQKHRNEPKEVKVMSEEFFKAIKEGDLPRVEQMIQRNSSLVNAKDPQGMSPVIVATYYNQSNIANRLIQSGAELNLYEASMTGRLETVKEMVSKKPADANSLSSDGFSALHLASFFGQIEVAKFLMQSGADVNSVSKNMMKVTPLHSAAAHNQVEIVELLLKHGAKVNAKQEGGFTALHAAAQSGNLELAKLLLKNGAEQQAKSDKGKTPLDLTKEEGREAGPKEGRERVARLLARTGA